MTSEVRIRYTSGRTYHFYCLSMTLVFLSASYFRGVTTGEFRRSIPWLFPAAFFLLEYLLSIWRPYIELRGNRLTIRQWAILPGVRIAAEDVAHHDFDCKKIRLHLKDGDTRDVRLDRVDRGRAEDLQQAISRWLLRYDSGRQTVRETTSFV